jgi:predicted nucleic acid-binding protein
MVVLDTNVLSEVIRRQPLPRVSTWFANQDLETLFICAVSEAELLYGLAILPEGRRRSMLTADIERLLNIGFAGRILSFDGPAAGDYAAIAADRRRSVRPIAIPDAQIAAITRSRGAAIATRNTGEFEGCGVEMINPWDDPM